MLCIQQKKGLSLIAYQAFTGQEFKGKGALCRIVLYALYLTVLYNVLYFTVLYNVLHHSTALN